MPAKCSRRLLFNLRYDFRTEFSAFANGGTVQIHPVQGFVPLLGSVL
jgi:hypothetical protein